MYAQTSLVCSIMCTWGIHGRMSIDTLDWHLDRYLMNILIDMQSTLYWPLINSGLVGGRMSTDSCASIKNESTVDRDVNRVLIKYWTRCQSGVLIDNPLRVLLIHMIRFVYRKGCQSCKLEVLNFIAKLVKTFFQMASLKLHCKVYNKRSHIILKTRRASI